MKCAACGFERCRWLILGLPEDRDWMPCANTECRSEKAPEGEAVVGTNEQERFLASLGVEG